MINIRYILFNFIKGNALEFILFSVMDHFGF